MFENLYLIVYGRFVGWFVDYLVFLIRFGFGFIFVDFF